MTEHPTAAPDANRSAAVLAGAIATLRREAPASQRPLYTTAIGAAQPALGPGAWIEACAEGAAMDVAAATAYAIASLS